MLNSNQAFLLVHKLKSAPQGDFTLGVKEKKTGEKIFNLPQVTNKLIVTLYGLVLAPRLKKKRIPSNLGTQFATLGANVPTFY
jgi:hypothetical protein